MSEGNLIMASDLLKSRINLTEVFSKPAIGHTLSESSWAALCILPAAQVTGMMEKCLFCDLENENFVINEAAISLISLVITW